jgi:hypothetical protein
MLVILEDQVESNFTILQEPIDTKRKYELRASLYQLACSLIATMHNYAVRGYSDITEIRSKLLSYSSSFLLQDTASQLTRQS